jgi:hypothetical protein
MTRFAELVVDELADAREAHDPINSAHEGYSVILEELDEYWEQVRAKRAARSRDRMLEELVQVAAMAQRTAEDLGLVVEIAMSHCRWHPHGCPPGIREAIAAWVARGRTPHPNGWRGGWPETRQETTD